MSKSSIYYVPEKKRKYYYASSGEYDIDMEPYIVNDYTLWANLNALDTITNPATVLVTELKGAKSYMYRVRFRSNVPDIFEKAEQEGGNVSQYVFFVPSDRFLRFESTNHCVPVPENNWEDYSFRFHALAAFYRLNVIPSLSMPLFEREDLFSNVCNDFYKKYHIEPPLNTALSSIFCNVFYALDFFGFITPSNLVEKDSVDASRNLADSFMNQQWGIGVPMKSKSSKSKKKSSNASKKKKRKSRRRRSDADNMSSDSNDNDDDNETENDLSEFISISDNTDEPSFDSLRSFAFSEIKFAIERYHNECFPWRASKLGLPPDVLDYTSYCNLLNAVQKVQRSLIKLHLLPTDCRTAQEALRAGVVKFQVQNKLPTGPCDLFTLRRLWNATSYGECDILSLCRLCGMETKEPEMPAYSNTLSELRVFGSQNDPELETPKKMDQIESVVNETLVRVRDRSEAQQLMMDEAQRSVQSQISRVEKAEEFARQILDSAGTIENILTAACEKGKKAEEIFDTANGVLDEIIEEHETIRKEFAKIKKRIDEERNGNKLLFLVNLVLLAIIIYRFIQAFS